MKRKRIWMAAAFCGVVFTFCGCCSTGPTDTKEEKPKTMKEVCQFLKDAGVYYIATVEGDQPRVRPFGTIHIFEGKLYIQTGRKKTELCAMKGGRVDPALRYAGRRQPARGESLDARRLPLPQEDVQRGRRQHAGALLQGRHGDDLLLLA